MTKGITAPHKLIKIISYLRSRYDCNKKYLILDAGGTKYSYQFFYELFPKSTIIQVNNCVDDIKDVKNSVKNARRYILCRS